MREKTTNMSKFSCQSLVLSIFSSIFADEIESELTEEDIPLFSIHQKVKAKVTQRC